MVRFIVRRLLQGIVLLFAISTIAYLLLNVGTSQIAGQILGPTATPAAIARENHVLGLDQPLLTRYWIWLSHAVVGNFGLSWVDSQPVVAAITSRLAVTLSVITGAMIVTTVIAVVLGIWSARRRGFADRLVQILSVLGSAVPNFLIAIFVVNIFAIGLHWFAPTGFVPITTSFGGWLTSVTLPIVALSVGAVAAIAAQVRGSVIDTMRQDWVRTLRSRGLSENRVLYRHVLRSASGPALSLLGVQFIGLIGGAVLIEQIFAIPGVGQIAVSATSQGDIPVVMGLVVAVGCIVVIVNLVIGLLQAFLNPKARLS